MSYRYDSDYDRELRAANDRETGLYATVTRRPSPLATAAYALAALGILAVLVAAAME